jgi:hypothetical protein
MLAPPFTMAPKLHAAGPPADTLDDQKGHSCRQRNWDSPTPLDALSLILEHMAMINARMDAHATKTAALRHRDVMRDAPLVKTPPQVQQAPSPQHAFFNPHEPPTLPHFHLGQPYEQRPLGAMPPPYGGPQSPTSHPQTAGGQPPFHVGQPFSNAHRGGHGGRGGRRPTIDPLVIGRVVHEATCFDKESSLTRFMKMIAPTMGPNTYFKQWKRNFLTFMSIKAAYLIPHRYTGVRSLARRSCTCRCVRLAVVARRLRKQAR